MSNSSHLYYYTTACTSFTPSAQQASYNMSNKQTDHTLTATVNEPPSSTPSSSSSLDTPPYPLYVLGIPMHNFSRPVQFLVCFSGVVFFYLLYGYSLVCGL